MELKLTKEAVLRLQYDPQGPETQLVWGVGEDKNLGIALSPAGDHVWIARVYVVQPNQTTKKRVGRLFRRPLTIRDKALEEARRERDIWKGEAAQGIDPIEKRRPGRSGSALDQESKPATVAVLIDTYMREYVARELEHRTERGYRKLAKHIKANLGEVPILELDKPRLLQFRNALSEYRETFNKARKLLSHAYRKAQLLDWKHEGRLMVPQDGFNPVALVPPYDTAATRKGGDPFEPEELSEFIAVAERYLRPFRPAVQPTRGHAPGRAAVAFPLFLLYTGLRKSEGMGLSWHNLNLPKSSGWSGYIDARRGAIRLVHHKTSRRKGARWVPLSPEAKRVLNLMAGQDDTWVFPGTIPGTRLVSPDKTFHRLQAEAGVRRRGLHQTRHTFIVRGLEEGAPIAYLAKAVGHSTVYVTETYANISDRAARAAAEVVGRSFALQWSWLEEGELEAAA